VFLAARLVPGLLEEPLHGSLYDLLSHRYRITMVRAEQTVTASVLDTREALLLEVPPVSPALVVVRTAYDQRGRAVEYAKTVYRGDRYSYRLTLERR
jgi:GntR family transcriptional regulator